ncbi:MAG TPA: UbiD family decarboxylase [Herbaspirillum sp.]|jgi:4-hydroxy-3-polyprenylbenzoate decarboxylase
MDAMNTQSLNEARGDLREFIRQAERAGQLELIQEADAHLEIGALFELSFEKRYPPVLLFDNIKGFPAGFRVVCNVRTAHFAAGDFNLETLKAFRRRQKDRREPIPPREVATGPVFENVDEGAKVNCLKFPAPKWHEGDGGKYIGTECMVITRDPDSDWVNFGTYRVMIQDEKTLSVFIEPGKHGDVIRRKYWARGESCPMAVCVGQAPILGAAAATPARHGESEYGLAGGLIGRPIDVVKCKASGLPIPADAEIVFDGFMPPPEQDSRLEGPFGEWPGYYASSAPEPVLQVHAVYHRNDPIIVGWPPTKPTKAGGAGGSITRLAAIWNALEGAGVPEVQGVWTMPGAGYRFSTVVSIKQLHPGHAKMAGMVAAGCGAGAYMTRMVIVVDDDIDITNPAEVMWALSTRWDPKTQTDIIDDCWTGHIDPRVPPEKRATGDISMSRIIMYAVRPYHWKDRYPSINEVSSAYADEVRRKWEGKLGFLKK